MAKLKVNKELCIMCGSCVGTYTDAFEFDDDGKAKCIKEVDSPEEVKSICPVGAIEDDK